MNQEAVFVSQQGLAWHERNKGKLKANAYSDLVFSVLERLPEPPKTVLDLGCSDGWLLNLIGQRYPDARLVGMDCSAEVLKRGRVSYPRIDFYQGVLGDGHVPSLSGSLVIVSYILHWVSRQRLMNALYQIDSLIQDGGYLLLADFLPDKPVAVPYKHTEGVFTYKANYPCMFLATELYHLVGDLVYNHDTNEKGLAPGHQRGIIALLRKGGFYAQG